MELYCAGVEDARVRVVRWGCEDGCAWEDGERGVFGVCEDCPGEEGEERKKTHDYKE